MDGNAHCSGVLPSPGDTRGDRCGVVSDGRRRNLVNGTVPCSFTISPTAKCIAAFKSYRRVRIACVGGVHAVDRVVLVWEGERKTVIYLCGFNRCFHI